jgi:acetyl esterase/lipase
MKTVSFAICRARSFRAICGSLAIALAPLSSGAQSVAQAPTPAMQAPEMPGVRVLRDVPYVPAAGPRQRLDLYLPETASGPATALPLVAYIHGGAWRAGSKNGCPARPLVHMGYAVASIEYRFSQDAPFPAQIEDCKAAIRWLRANAKQYHIDPAHIGVWGASAGGHLVALLGVTGTDRQFDVGANLDQSSAVQCVVDFFGPADFLHGPLKGAQFDQPGNVLYQLFGGPLSTHEALAQSASPVTYVNKSDPPFLILHGDMDQTVPLQQSEELNADLQNAGVESTLQIVAGSGHGGKGFFSQENRKLIIDFLNRHLKAGSGA